MKDTPEVLETINCRADGCYTPDGQPWDPNRDNPTRPYPNNFYHDDGTQHIGPLMRVRYRPHSWAWVVPETEQVVA